MRPSPSDEGRCSRACVCSAPQCQSRCTLRDARAARVREHVEDVELWLGAIEVFLAQIGGVECPAFIPKALPLRLEPIKGIRFPARAHVRLRLLSSRAKSRDDREFERDEFAPGNAQ